MIEVWKSVDLSHEEPADAVLVKGEGHEQVTLRVLGARVQAVSGGAASRQRNSVTAKVGTALAVMLYTVALLAAFTGPAETAHIAGSSSGAALLAGAAGAIVVLGLILLFNRKPRSRA